jgi:hypothetical protein
MQQKENNNNNNTHHWNHQCRLILLFLFSIGLLVGTAQSIDEESRGDNVGSSQKNGRVGVEFQANRLFKKPMRSWYDHPTRSVMQRNEEDEAEEDEERRDTSNRSSRTTTIRRHVQQSSPSCPKLCRRKWIVPGRCSRNYKKVNGRWGSFATTRNRCLSGCCSDDKVGTGCCVVLE